MMIFIAKFRQVEIMESAEFGTCDGVVLSAASFSHYHFWVFTSSRQMNTHQPKSRTMSLWHFYSQISIFDCIQSNEGSLSGESTESAANVYRFITKSHATHEYIVVPICQHPISHTQNECLWAAATEQKIRETNRFCLKSGRKWFTDSGRLQRYHPWLIAHGLEWVRIKEAWIYRSSFRMFGWRHLSCVRVNVKQCEVIDSGGLWLSMTLNRMYGMFG